MHSFYTRVEAVFKNIALKVDGEIPTGERWHHDLLEQMRTDLKDLRPTVISDELKGDLKELLAFRHLIRNIYSFTTDEKQLIRLCTGLGALSAKLFEELERFVEFLQNSGENS